MAKWMKKVKRVFRKKPWLKWAVLGGGAVLIGIAALLLLTGGPAEKPPLGSGGNVQTITLVAGGDLNVTDSTIASGKTGETYVTVTADESVTSGEKTQRQTALTFRFVLEGDEWKLDTSVSLVYNENYN